MKKENTIEYWKQFIKNWKLNNEKELNMALSKLNAKLNLLRQIYDGGFSEALKSVVNDEYKFICIQSSAIHEVMRELSK